MRSRGGSFCRRCCASAVPRVAGIQSHDGDGKGGRPVGVGETDDGLQLVAPSIGLASRRARPWRRERGELVSTTGSACVRA